MQRLTPPFPNATPTGPSMTGRKGSVADPVPVVAESACSEALHASPRRSSVSIDATLAEQPQRRGSSPPRRGSTAEGRTLTRDDLKKHSETLERQLSRSQHRVETLTRELGLRDDLVHAVEAERDAVRALVRQAEQQLEEGREAGARLQARLDALEPELAEARGVAAQARQSVAVLQAERQSLVQLANLLQQQLKQQQAATAALVARVDAAESRADDLVATRDAAAKAAAEAVQGMNVVKAEMKGVEEREAARTLSLAAERDNARERCAAVEARNAELQAQHEARLTAQGTCAEELAKLEAEQRASEELRRRAEARLEEALATIAGGAEHVLRATHAEEKASEAAARAEAAANRAAELERERDAVAQQRAEAHERLGVLGAEKRAAEERMGAQQAHHEAERAALLERLRLLERSAAQGEASALAAAELDAARAARREGDERERALWERNAVLAAQADVAARRGAAAAQAEARVELLEQRLQAAEISNDELQRGASERARHDDGEAAGTRALVTSEVVQALLNFQSSLSHGARHSLSPFLALEAAAHAGSNAASQHAATPYVHTPHTPSSSSSARALAGAHHALGGGGLAARHGGVGGSAAAAAAAAASAKLAEFRAGGSSPERTRAAPAAASAASLQSLQRGLSPSPAARPGCGRRQ